LLECCYGIQKSRLESCNGDIYIYALLKMDDDTPPSQKEKGAAASNATPYLEFLRSFDLRKLWAT
jgi:hypothetical protein